MPQLPLATRSLWTIGIEVRAAYKIVSWWAQNHTSYKSYINFLGDLTNETLEWEPSNEFGRILIAPDLAKGDGTGAIATARSPFGHDQGTVLRTSIWTFGGCTNPLDSKLFVWRQPHVSVESGRLDADY